MENFDLVDPAGRRHFLKRAGAAALVGLPATILMATSAAAEEAGLSSRRQRCRKVQVDVDQECTAPANPPSNGCSISGTLPGRGIDGTDIVWMVTLFHGTEWRIQFQAFTEETDRECQYPITVRGSYSGDGLSEVRFKTSAPLELGLTPHEYPQLTLRIDSVRIDPCHPFCG